MDRGGAAPAREQAGMDIEAAASWDGEKIGGEDQAVGDDDRGVEIEAGEMGEFGLVVAQAGGGAERKAEASGGAVDRGEGELVAAAGGFGGLAIDGFDVVAGLVEGFEGGDGEVGRAHEGEVEGGAHRWVRAVDFSSAFSRCSLASLRSKILRLRGVR